MGGQAWSAPFAAIACTMKEATNSAMQDMLKETSLAVRTSSSREDRMCAKGDATYAKENAICAKEDVI